ncbi:MAG: 30S ribosomal protein S7 [Patescibacteria group bacterium]
MQPAPKRQVAPDPKHRNVIIGKFINHVMERGKKTVAQGVVYDMLEIVSEKTKQDPLEIFDSAIRNVSPAVEVKSRRIGGANYQIPIEVRGDRRLMLAMRWIINAARGQKGRKMSQKLADEIIAAANSQGEAIKKKEDVQRMAEANRAFAHFA